MFVISNCGETKEEVGGETVILNCFSGNDASLLVMFHCKNLSREHTEKLRGTENVRNM